jgi:hypothetical protein
MLAHACRIGRQIGRRSYEKGYSVGAPSPAAELRTMSVLLIMRSLLGRELANRADPLGWRGVGVVIGRIPGMRRQVRQIFYC